MLLRMSSVAWNHMLQTKTICAELLLEMLKYIYINTLETGTQYSVIDVSQCKETIYQDFQKIGSSCFRISGKAVEMIMNYDKFTLS